MSRITIATLASLLLAAGCSSSNPTPKVDAGMDGGGADNKGLDAPAGKDMGGSDAPAVDAPAADAPAGTPQKLVILHTNDLHAHLMGQAPEADYSPATLNDDLTIGGMARLATAIGTAKAQAAAAGTPTLLLDAGDFMMGTLFELLATADPPELKFMKALGYDATCLGNHEFDYTPAGLAGILHAATSTTTTDADGGVTTTPRATIPILSSNMVFNDDPDGGAGDDQLKAFVTAGVIQKKLVKTVGTLKVGFFGLLGKDAVQVTPQLAPLTFTPIATAAAAMVNELRTVDKVDLVIALSHSGIHSDGTGEDADLAAAVPGIDIIISGHTHDRITAGTRLVTRAADAGAGSTLIVTAGAYGQYLGNLQVTVVPSGVPGGVPQVTVDNYNLLPVDDKIMGDATTQAGVDLAIAGVNTALAAGGVPVMYKSPVAATGVDIGLPTYAEAPVGDLVTDSYRKVTAALQPTAPPVIAVEANGQIRADIAKGKTGAIWFADLFRVLPIGIGPDMVPGFPLVTFYLNAKDLRAGLELDAVGTTLDNQYFLQVSGMKFTYDTTKPPFGRVTSISLVDDTGTATQLTNLNDTTTCYKVVATNYVAGLLGLVKTLTSGLLEVNAKAADCTTLIDPTTPANYVNANPTGTARELKHWQALLQYVSGLPNNTVPAAYGAAQGRITKTP